MATDSRSSTTLLVAPKLPDRPPSEWTYRDAAAAVAVAQGGHADTPLDAHALKANAAYAEHGDHWQDGDGWIGPDGGPDARRRADVLQTVRRQFTPVDVIGEVLWRYTSALLKRRPSIVVTPRGSAPAAPPADGADPATDAAADALQAEADALREALEVWARESRFTDALKRAVRRSRWATRGALRVWVPDGRLVEVVPDDGAPGDAAAVSGDGVTGKTVQPVDPGATAPATATAAGSRRVERGLPTGLSLAQALACVEIMAPPPDEAAVLVDEATQLPIGVFLTTDAAGMRHAEVWYVDPTTGDTVCRLVPDQATRAGRAARNRRIATGAGDGVAGAAPATDEAARLPLGGRLPIVEMVGDLLITEPVRRQQAQANFFNSLVNRVCETAGFRERYVMNAAPHGYWTDRPLAREKPLAVETIDGTTYYLYPAPRTLGAAVTTELRGFPVDVDDAGRKQVTTPSVTFAEPTDPAYLTRSVQFARAMILDQCRQGHVLGTAVEQSGDSRQQARADFETDVSAGAEAVEALASEALAVVLSYAARMAADGTRLATVFERHSIRVQVHVDTGPRSSDEQRADGEAVAGGRLSLATALARDGVENVGEELARLAQDPEVRARRSRAQAEAVAAWTTAGAGLAAAAALVGLTDAERDLLVTNAGAAPGDDGVTQ